MSKWCEGSLEVQCSLDILSRALSETHPEWENYLETDEGGGLALLRYTPTGKSDDIVPTGYSLVIPGGRHGDLLSKAKAPSAKNTKGGCPGRGSNNDWGFKAQTGNKWVLEYGDFGSGSADMLKNELNTEVKARIAKLKLAQHAALISGFVDTTEEEDEDTCRITFKTTVGNAKKLIALG